MAKELKEKLEVCYGPTISDRTSFRRDRRRKQGKRNSITGRRRRLGKSWRYVATPFTLTERHTDSSQVERKRKELELKGKEPPALKERLEV